MDMKVMTDDTKLQLIEKKYKESKDAVIARFKTILREAFSKPAVLLTPETYQDSFSENAQWLWAERYYVMRYDSSVNGGLRKEKTIYEVIQRVTRSLVCEERQEDYIFDDDFKEWLANLERHVMSDLLEKRFMFGSPVLFNAGFANVKDPDLADLYYAPIGSLTAMDYVKIRQAKHKGQMMCSCFTLPVNDMLESDGTVDHETNLPSMGIFNSVMAAGRISQSGGGVGTNFSKIRPKGYPIGEGDSGYASGPVSFMKLWDTAGEVIVQGGKRRAALMGILDSDHPDILEFIDAKTQEGVLPYFNISVNVKEDLASIVTDPSNREGGIPCRTWGDEKIKIIDATTLWDKLCQSAWKRGDPGFLCLDMAQRDNIMQLDSRYLLNTSNPCGERIQPLFSACLLGSINVDAMAHDIMQASGEALNKDTYRWACIKDHTHPFTAQIIRAMYYMDLMVDASTYPLPEIRDVAERSRPIGLGLMGLANLFLKSGLEYGNLLSQRMTENIFASLAGVSMFTTIALGALKGAFPDADAACRLMSCWHPNEAWTTQTALREAQPLLNRCAPESNFTEEINVKVWTDVVANNRWFRNSSRLSVAPNGSISMLLDTSGGIEPNFAWHWTRRMKSKDGVTNIERTYWHPLVLEGYKKDILAKGVHPSEDCKHWKTANELSYHEHLTILGVAAAYVDSGISKTINLPEHALVDDVDYIYKWALKNKVKGLTVYRDGSRREQPIEAIKKEPAKPVVPETTTNRKLKKRPPLAVGLTNKSGTPWGSLYTTLTFGDDGKPFEVFVTLGKSGSELKSFTEALSRVISVALRSGSEIEDILSTLDGLSGQEIWVIDDPEDKDKEYVVKSIPDALSKSLRIIMGSRLPGSDEGHGTTEAQGNTELPSNTKGTCPECGSPTITIGGCPYCLTCGWSKCK